MFIPEVRLTNIFIGYLERTHSPFTLPPDYEKCATHEHIQNNKSADRGHLGYMSICFFIIYIILLRESISHTRQAL